jgi:hypothetical protein
LSLVTFQYNASKHSATGVTPFKARFGVEPFKFDYGFELRFRPSDKPTDLATRLDEIHAQLLSKGIRSREAAARTHDKAVHEVEFANGARVLVYDEPTAAGQGRKMRTPWLGPYRVVKRLSRVGYLLRAESDARTARAHVNRIRAVRSGVNESPRKPECGRTRVECFVPSWNAERETGGWSIRFHELDDVAMHWFPNVTSRRLSYGRTTCSARTREAQREQMLRSEGDCDATRRSGVSDLR